MTLASFSLSGNTPVDNDRFIMYKNGCIMAGVISFSRRGPMLSVILVTVNLILDTL